jgi:hypothetical protein
MLTTHLHSGPRLRMELYPDTLYTPSRRGQEKHDFSKATADIYYIKFSKMYFNSCSNPPNTLTLINGSP